MAEKIKVVQMGIGPIATKITPLLLERKQFALTGAIDIDPQKVGRDLGEVADLPQPLGIPIRSDTGEALRELHPDIVVLTSSSTVAAIQPQVLEIVGAGVNVVTTCEELSYPWLTRPDLAGKIDAAAKDKGVSVLATGVNPGFLMDFLPTTLTGICQQVNKIHVERIQNAQFRRIPFQKKIGAGLTPEQFEQAVAAKILRHVGLTESMHMIAHSMGWTLDKTEDIIKPVLAETQVKTPDLSIPPGHAVGVNQSGHGYRNGEEVITLIFRATIGEPEPRDRIVIDGTPPIDMTIKDGINGDIATCMITVNAIPRVVQAAPGLRTMVDIGTIAFLA